MTYPAIHAEVHQTSVGTPYLKEPGVVMLSAPAFDNSEMFRFLSAFDQDFSQYLEDPVTVEDGAHLCKTSGQLCYFSFGRKRTMNAESDRYFVNIRESGHGSVLEHANYTLLFYGTSRSLSHELVRHRAGVAISQVSQRYVSGKTLRFVERPEYQNPIGLHTLFEDRIDLAAREYDGIAARLQASMADQLAALASTDRRKAVNRAARSLLPNETEAPIVVTANVRAWRHILEMRASQYAEPEIRAAAYNAYLCLVQQSPILFADYETVTLPDGTKAVTTKTPKV